ncbi:hypothetical protein PVL29_025896 [Vitis rotundifolia]|uniref:Coiled-coil domain-containing protein 22 n=1 Tax=Vitis rotundifolia TaxID=103349 RepID=A0AA39D738_VITRO|nr:hypothetical protein PVL29_025896 [Vitis rotundifolia]
MCCLQQFLYPSEEDLYKLVRFLVEKLPESSEGGKTAGGNDIRAREKIKEDDLPSTSKHWTEKPDNQGVCLHFPNVGAKLKDLRLKSEVQESSDNESENESGTRANKAYSIQQKMDGVAVVDVSIPGTQDLSKEELNSLENGTDLVEKSEDSRRDASGNVEMSTQRDDKNVLTSFQEQSLKIKSRIEMLQNQEKLLIEEVTSKNLESQHLEEEYNLLKSAMEMEFDDQHPVDLFIEQLNERIESGKRNLVELESQWETLRKPLEEKKRSLEGSVYATVPGAQEKLQKLKEFELEKQSILYEIKKREEEHSKLSADLEKQPKLPSRRSYIQRITEITKNSRKQDADIERILKDTREVQLESNSVQERRDRTYAVVDETIFREAKKDPVGRQAYMLLTSIHESFEQIAEKILATDRTRREVTEHEAKLAAMASRSLNINKLQADLDAIRQENECLEQRLQDDPLDSSS